MRFLPQKPAAQNRQDKKGQPCNRQTARKRFLSKAPVTFSNPAQGGSFALKSAKREVCILWPLVSPKSARSSLRDELRTEQLAWGRSLGSTRSPWPSPKATHPLPPHHGFVRLIHLNNSIDRLACYCSQPASCHKRLRAPKPSFPAMSYSCMAWLGCKGRGLSGLAMERPGDPLLRMTLRTSLRKPK